MMKKTVLFLALLMALCFVSAAAESIPVPSAPFSMEMAIPADAALNIIAYDDDYTLATIDYAASDRVQYLITMAPSEEFHGRSMDELNEDDLTLIFNESSADYDMPDYTTQTLENGLKVMIIRESGDHAMDFIITLRSGCFIQLTYAHEDYAEITAEEEAEALNLFGHILITDIAN